MTISKFRALEHAAKEIKDYCDQFKVCEDCLFEKEYLICPFRRESGLPYKWEFEKKCEEEGMTRHGKWIPWDTDTRGCTLRFACSKCGNVTKMPVLIDYSISWYAYCPRCGSAMLHRVDDCPKGLDVCDPASCEYYSEEEDDN